jgi:hypothetical protein
MTGNHRRWLPTAVVVLAVAALSVAARRTGGLDNGVADGLWWNVRPVAALMSVVVLVMVATTFAKHRDDGYGPLRRASTATALILVAAAVLTPIGLLFFGRQPAPDLPPSPFEPDPASPSISSGTGTRIRNIKEPTAGPGTSVPDWASRAVLSLVLLAAVALIGYVVYRLVAQRWFSRAALPTFEFEDLVDADLEQLAEAVAAGSRALAYQGEAREAVIACYAAMEDALSAAGSGRRATDTPEDFLRRVTGAQLIPAGPARRLTDLFREARFSRHRIAESKRDEARAALDAIAEHLRARAAEAEAALAARTAAAVGAGPGTGPGTGTGTTTNPGPASPGGRR